MEPEPAASTAAASTEEATAPAVPQEFEIPAIIAQMVAADASETYVFKQFNYTVDKHEVRCDCSRYLAVAHRDI